MTDIKYQEDFYSTLKVGPGKNRIKALNRKISIINVKRIFFQSESKDHQIQYRNLEENSLLLETNDIHVFTMVDNDIYFKLNIEKPSKSNNNSKNLMKLNQYESELRDLLSAGASFQEWPKLKRRAERFIEKLCKFCSLCLQASYEQIFELEPYDLVTFPNFHYFCLFDSRDFSINYYKIQFEKIEYINIIDLGQVIYHDIDQNQYYRFHNNNAIFSYYDDFGYSIWWIKLQKFLNKFYLFLSEEQETETQENPFNPQNLPEYFDVNCFFRFLQEEEASENLNQDLGYSLKKIGSANKQVKTSLVSTIAVQIFETQKKISVDNLTTVEKTALLEDFTECMKGFLKQQPEEVDEQKEPSNEQQSDNLLELFRSESDYKKEKALWKDFLNSAKASRILSYFTELLEGFVKPKRDYSEDYLPSYLEEKSEDISEKDIEIINWLLKIANKCQITSNSVNSLNDEPLKPAFYHLWKSLPFSQEMRNSDGYQKGLNSIF